MYNFSRISRVFGAKSRLFRSCVVPSHRRGFKGFSVSDEVRFALENNEPVVALESTIITHGMPFPQNVECALQVEGVVRERGAVPATVAIIEGTVTVGLDKDKLTQLGDVKTSNPVKTSRRDLAYVVSNKLNGGTTVSGTLIVASKVGIPIFATGGIGGVHREGELTFDVSADLIELGKSNVAVVSSGIKSILDIPKTLEYLETQGVFVATFGDPPTLDFPAFYCRKSGCRVPYAVRDAAQAARIIQTSSCQMELRSGMLFAVPVPQEFALDQAVVDGVIERALETAKEEGVAGKSVTPYLLGKIAEITQGKSLETNIALIKNNAGVAAEIAVALSSLRKGTKKRSGGGTQKKPVVIGGSNLDCSVKLKDDDIKIDGRIHNGKFTLSAGGVGRNIAEALSKLGCPPIFLSAVGGDEQGKILRNRGMNENFEHVRVLEDQSTAQCTVVCDSNGDCRFLLGDMEIHQQITPEMIRENEALIKTAPLIVFDANLSIPTISAILQLAHEHNIPTFFEPTDLEISSKPFATPFWKSIKYITPNLNELKHIAQHLLPPEPQASPLRSKSPAPFSSHRDNKISEAAEICRRLVDHVDCIIVTLGEAGLLIARKHSATEPLLLPLVRREESSGSRRKEVQIRHYPAEKLQRRLDNVSGAGDSLASGLVAAMLDGLSEEKCVSVGFAAAKTALFSSSPVAEELFGKTHGAWKSSAEYVQLM